MSGHNESQPWLERYWQVLLILFGIAVVAIWISYKP